MLEHFWRIRVTIFSVNFGTIAMGGLAGWLIGRAVENPRMGLAVGVIAALPIALVLTIVAVKRQTPDILERNRAERESDPQLPEGDQANDGGSPHLATNENEKEGRE